MGAIPTEASTFFDSTRRWSNSKTSVFQTENAGAAPYLDEIERTLKFSTTGSVAGIFVESVQGYGGIIRMPRGYMSGAAERVRAAGGLYIADEAF